MALRQHKKLIYAFLVLSLVVGLSTASPNTNRNDDKQVEGAPQRKGKSILGSIADTIGLILDIGSFAISAIEFFYELHDRAKAEGLFSINNLSKWPLGNMQIRVLAGETTDLPNIVLPGYTEAIAVNQVGTFKRFTQGYAAFDTVPGFYCMFYWNIEGSMKVRKQGNSLGVGCKPSNETIENHSVLENIDTDTLSNDYLNLAHSSDQSQNTVRFCTKDLCVFGIMGSSHQVEANIDIVPRLVGDLAPSLVEDLVTNQNESQRLLDNLLDEDNCKIDCLYKGVSSLSCRPTSDIVTFLWIGVFFAVCPIHVM